MVNARDRFPRIGSPPHPQNRSGIEERADMRSRFCSLLLLAVPFGFGQTISGVIHDSQGAGIPASSVSLVARDNTARADAVSDSSGRYRFERVSPGAYLLEAAAAGFTASGARPVSIGNTDQQVDIQLDIAAVQTAVVVTASGTAQTTDEISKSVSAVDAS